MYDTPKKLEVTVSLPALGEDIHSGTVVKILAQAGDRIATGDTLVELETGKAVVPVPSPVSGKILESLVKEGQEIQVGQELAVMEAEEQLEEQAVPISPRRGGPVYPPKDGRPHRVAPTVTNAGMKTSSFHIHAGPATRKFARELGVDLHFVDGTRRGGRIDREDVKAYVRDLARLVWSVSRAPKQQYPDPGRFGEVEYKPLSPLRKAVAAQMTAANTIPHVFQSHEIEIGGLLNYLDSRKKKKAPVTLTAVLVKVLADVLKEMPDFNSSLDMDNHVQVVKNYVHIGIAVDTPAGLIVPVLKHADQKSIDNIADELSHLSQAARARSVSPEELQGASFSVSNLGGMGAGPFAPLVNPPQVAALGVAKKITKPVYENKKWIPKSFLPLVLSYDHRLIDGAQAVRFLLALEKKMMERVECDV